MLEYKEGDILKLSFYDELNYIECLSGWYLLLIELNREIKNIEEEFNIQNKIKAIQVKQKFGELRIYFSVDESVENHEKTEDIHIKVNQEINKAENCSRHICEICSSHGEIINKSSILMARCMNCGS